jgi:hypothetical protein
MAFALRNLSVLAYANGFTLWHYKSAADALPAINAGGYFNDAGDMLSAGDFVIVSAPTGGRMLCVVPDQRGLNTVPIA